MSKKVLIIETSLRPNSNSDRLAKSFAEGARAAGNEVEIVSLKGKNIKFCTGCFGCLKIGHCVMKDDADEITEKMLEAEVIAWSTPIYYYEMSGQMKTMIDRANSLYPRDYKFRDIYMLTTAVSGLQGWVDCFAKAELKGKVFAGGVNDSGEIEGHKALKEAYEMGKAI